MRKRRERTGGSCMCYGSDALELNINYLSAVLAFRQKQ